MPDFDYLKFDVCSGERPSEYAVQFGQQNALDHFQRADCWWREAHHKVPFSIILVKLSSNLGNSLLRFFVAYEIVWGERFPPTFLYTLNNYGLRNNEATNNPNFQIIEWCLRFFRDETNVTLQIDKKPALRYRPKSIGVWVLRRTIFHFRYRWIGFTEYAMEADYRSSNHNEAFGEGSEVGTTQIDSHLGKMTFSE